MILGRVSRRSRVFPHKRRNRHSPVMLEGPGGLQRSHRDQAKTSAKGAGQHRASGRASGERAPTSVRHSRSELNALDKDASATPNQHAPGQVYRQGSEEQSGRSRRAAKEANLPLMAWLRANARSAPTQLGSLRPKLGPFRPKPGSVRLKLGADKVVMNEGVKRELQQLRDRQCLHTN